MTTRNGPTHDATGKGDATEGFSRDEFPLPEAPRTASPVPWLTSIHATPGRGNYADPSHRGNCPGLLIRDLFLCYRPSRRLDPMQGGGTCRDVCSELGIPFEGRDLKTGFDATRPDSFRGLGVFDFIGMHPPCWNMIRYNERDRRCLSSAPSVKEFVAALRAVSSNCRSVLSPHAKLAALMGDGKHEGRYLALPCRTMNAAVAEGYWLAAPEIVRFGHGSTSSRKIYSTSFIPRLHDLCYVLEPRSYADGKQNREQGGNPR